LKPIKPCKLVSKPKNAFMYGFDYFVEKPNEKTLTILTNL
jgi:hypothetical protein